MNVLSVNNFGIDDKLSHNLLRYIRNINGPRIGTWCAPCTLCIPSTLGHYSLFSI